jgi:adenosylhomocysteinase
MSLVDKGNSRIEWASREMPVMKIIKDFFIDQQPFSGKIVAACMHITTETANLVQTLVAGGAQVHLCASNPLSTQDDVVEALNISDNIFVYAKHGDSPEEYYNNIKKVLNSKPHLVMDDGCDLVNYLYTKEPMLLENVIGGTEETTTGVQRLKAMEREGLLKYPIITVNDALTKHMFDNQYGTGQSTLDGIIRATNILLAGKVIVIAGYGWCGKGLAAKARGMGARVIVTEIDPIKALQAHMDGFDVYTMNDACNYGDIFITVTGNKNVIDSWHFRQMKDGAILCNSGHFDSEINIKALEKIATSFKPVKENVMEYFIEDTYQGFKIYVLGEGRLVNLACAEGHPSCVMDMSFANQALCASYLCSVHLQPGLHSVPNEVDNFVADIKLKSLNLEIDELTSEQKIYLNSWQEGT